MTPWLISRLTVIKDTLKIFVVCLGFFPDVSDVKESTCNAGVAGSILGLGRSPGERNGNPL